MQKHIARAALLSASLSLLTNPAFATATTVNSANSPHAPLTLSTNDSLTVTSTGTVSSTDGTTVAVTVSGTGASIDNSGKITSTGGTPGGKNRAVRNNTAGVAFTLTNEATGTISSAGSDAFQMNVAGSTVTMKNYGTVSATGSGDQAINWNYGLNSSGLVTASSNVLYNYSGASITSSEADAVRLNAGAALYNSGLIKSTTATGSSSDGIDMQVNNTGVTIVNAGSTTGSGVGTIEGGRHGITGGQQTDTADAAGTTAGNKNGAYDSSFTLSITNNTGGTIQGDNGSGVNIDGVSNKEQVTIVNGGTITGTSTTGDSDGVDVDGIVNINNSGTIRSLNAASTETSEGVTVGGGTIVNSGLIEGSNSTGAGRGITLAGIDHTTTNGTDTNIAVQKIYANVFSQDGTTQTNATGATYVTNNANGVIKGDSNSGIAIAGSATTGTSYGVVITNNAGAKIEGGGSVAVIDGSVAVGGTVAPTASTNAETVINYGTIQADGTGKAISLGSGVNNVQILGGAASVNADMSGGTTNGSNTLTIDPGAGNSFSYSHSFSNFANVNIKSGTVTLSGASIYTGTTTISGGTTYVDNTTGSATGTGSVLVGTAAGGATLAGSGIIKTDNGSKGVVLAANSSLVSGDIRSGNTDGHGLTLDNTAAKAVILDASIPTANLTFYLSAGTTLGAGHVTYDTPNLNSSFLTVLGDTAGELKFAASGDTVTLDDLTGGSLQLKLSVPYLLIRATDNADYLGLLTTGDVDGKTNQNGFVTNVTLNSDFTAKYAGARLYLDNGQLEVVPEPGTWALMIGGLGMLALLRFRRSRQ